MTQEELAAQLTQSANAVRAIGTKIEALKAQVAEANNAKPALQAAANALATDLANVVALFPNP